MTAVADSPPRQGGVRPGWLAAPAVVFLGFWFLWPVWSFLILSVEGGSFVHLEKALLDGLYLKVLFETVKIAAMVTAICLVVAFPVAHYLSTASRIGFVIGIICLLLPFWTSVLVRTYSWMVLLGRNGIINRLLLDWQLIDEPLRMLNNTPAVVIGMVHALLPYAVFPLFAAIRRIDPNLLLAAQGLGAGGVRTFTRIYLPLTMPGVLAATSLVFITAVGYFITPALLGGGRVMMIAVMIERQVREALNWGFAAALSIVLLATILLVYGGLRRLMRTREA